MTLILKTSLQPFFWLSEKHSTAHSQICVVSGNQWQEFFPSKKAWIDLIQAKKQQEREI
jgi:hypothetical protein